MIYEIVVDQVRGRITVAAHTELAQHAPSIRAGHIASVCPYYHRHAQRTVAEFFRTRVNSVAIPLCVRNNPKAAGVDIAPSFLHQPAEVNVVGVNDGGFSHLEFTHFAMAIEDTPAFRLIVGARAIALPASLAAAKACGASLAPPTQSSRWWYSYGICSRLASTRKPLGCR